MRRRPKLEKVINKISDDISAHEVLEELDAAGYVVIERKTRERDLRRFWRQAAATEWAERDRDSTMAWAQSICERERRLERRCSFLYEKAIAHGATRDDLVQDDLDP